MRTRITTIVILMLCVIPSFSQERGFFRIYPSEGNKFKVSCAIETEGGSFIVALNNDLYGDSCARLLKLSPEGDVTNSVYVDEPDKFFLLYRLFRHPFNHGSFIGMGLYSFFDTIPSPFKISVPYLVHFDDGLNITMRKQVELPESLERKSISTFEAMFNKDWNLFGEYMFFTPSIPPSDYRRLFTEMTVDGDFIRIVEDTLDLQITGGPEAVFEFPITHEVGTLRWGDPEQRPEQVHKLYKLDEDFVAEELNEFRRFGFDTLSYNISHISTRYNSLVYHGADILPLDDTTLLFSMKTDEHWYQWWPEPIDTNIFITDPSAVLFKTDLEGNIGDYYVIKSYNDSIEVVPWVCSVGITKANVPGRKDIYHCCYSQYSDLCENPNTLTITKLTDDFEILWQKSYTVPEVYLEAHHLMVTSDGGCLVVGSVTRGCNQPYSQGERNEWFALKLNPDGTVGMNEGGIEVRPYAFYPNPVKERLLMQFSPDVQPAQVELYDLQGRLVCMQNKAFESIDIGQLPAGTYTMRVTLVDGKAYSDKVVKE